MWYKDDAALQKLECIISSLIWHQQELANAGVDFRPKILEIIILNDFFTCNYSEQLLKYFSDNKKIYPN